MDLILNDWKHLLRTETSQKSLLKIFYYNNKVTMKVKDFQKLSNKEIYFTFQSNSTKYNKLFKLISRPNLLEDAIFSFLISGIKLLLIGLRINIFIFFFL